MEQKYFSESNIADVMGVSRATIKKWRENKMLTPLSVTSRKGEYIYDVSELLHLEPIKEMFESSWEQEMKTVPLRPYTSIELFAGAGGLALGLEKAGFRHVLLNEFEKNACDTLRKNRPEWNVLSGDVRGIDFSSYRGKVDLISGGFPCQAFSYAGKGGGFDDARGTLFFELARAVKEVHPKVLLGENVKGLLSHDGGKTFEVIKNTIAELGYTLIEPRVLKAVMYRVPQKRERIFLIAVRNDLAENVEYRWPSPYRRVMTLRDAFYAGELYENDVPASDGAKYPVGKSLVMAQVPEGGDWRDLPKEVAEKYMGGSYKLGGGKTGMARRLSLDEPSLTLTCSPSQKQTERCHPLETRPLSVREYARIQTFPDDWTFCGSLLHQYKQIGNAVPVNLAWAVGRSLIRLLNQMPLRDSEELPEITMTIGGSRPSLFDR
ncbi:MAG: DNA (cytosine-5-)-methyltransferase [Porphyromonas sp.]|nr:DNA (cytosine-5-)-methyltransferase [Bacteroidales bacterium]MDY3100614.1 DNA (cytosine-5-)-methyltransferase [Porphyromonas sp.]